MHRSTDFGAFLLFAFMLVLACWAFARVFRILRERAKRRKLVNNTVAAIKEVFGSKPKWDRPNNGSLTDLTQEQVEFMWENSQCPYCHSSLFEGPSGGLSMNMFCGNPDCDSRFNITLPGFVASPTGDSASIPAWGEFTGSCPPHFLQWRREELAKVVEVEGELGLEKFHHGMLP